MRVRVDGRTYAGRAVDLSAHALDPTAVAAAIREPGRDGREAARAVAVDCPPPGPVHERVGVVRRGMARPGRTALAAAARSRGLTAPQDEAAAAVAARLAELDAPSVDAEAARRRVAAAGAERERLRERVARLQGRVRARRDAGLDATDAEAALSDAVRSFSEVETERAAAEQALARVRERDRETRDVRERRLRAEDRLANLRRRARAHLAAAVREEVAAAVAAAPGEATDVETAAPVTLALAVVRVAAVDAPVVLVDAPFADVARAAEWLGAPVVQV